MPTAGSRFRISTLQINVASKSKSLHVGSVVLSEEEAHEELRLKMRLHFIAGWQVKWIPDRIDGFVATKNRTKRIVTIIEKQAMEDS